MCALSIVKDRELNNAFIDLSIVLSRTLQPPVVECLYAESGESVVHSPPAPELPHVKEIELELKEKNMLFQKSHIELGRVIGQGM